MRSHDFLEKKKNHSILYTISNCTHHFFFILSWRKRNYFSERSVLGSKNIVVKQKFVSSRCAWLLTGLRQIYCLRQKYMGNFGNNIFLWKLIWIIRRFSKARGIWQPFVCWKIRRTAMFSFNKLFLSDTTSLAKITNVPVSYSLMV